MNSDSIVFLYDGSFEGLFTVLFIAFKKRIKPNNIVSEDNYIPGLFDKVINIKTNDNYYNYSIKKVYEKLSEYSVYQIYQVFLSSNSNKEMVLYDYIVNGFTYGKKLDYLRTIPSVLSVQNIKRNVSFEAHRLKGFVRFSELSNKILFASISPDNNVLEILSYHFSKRMPNEIWIIKDEKRCIASIYNKKKFLIVPTNTNETKVEYSSGEKEIKRMWKLFYDTIAIKERKNKRCQMNFMPKKYWKYMFETEENNEQNNC